MVYETENSRVMVILKEPRLGYSRTNITLTALTAKSLVRHNGAKFSNQFLTGIFAARVVVN